MEARSFFRPAVSLVMLAAGMVMSATAFSLFADDRVRLLWYVAAFLPVGLGVMREAWECAVKKDVFSEFMLMSVASIGAFAIGEYPEAVAVMLFYCIGEALQDMAVDRARDTIKAMMEFRPDHATVVTDGTTVTKDPADVRPGDIIEVRPGERVPLDGELTTADAAFNTAALTGESAPRTIEKGKEVLAGMTPADSVVRLRVTREAGRSAIARMLEMVEQAAERKAPAELFIRKFARVYTPVVIALAALTAVVPYLWSLADAGFAYDAGTWVYRALIFLVISCPCALVISIPLSYFGGIGAASRQGILFKGGNYLDAITQVDTVVFDKTGTLTRGEFSVVKVVADDPDALTRAVASMERGSNHPIARAVKAYAKDAELLDREGVDYPKELADVAETIVACAKDGRYAGCLLLADRPKADAREAVRALRAAGVGSIEILSGDKQALVDKVAEELQVDRGCGDLLPEGKVNRIEDIRRQGRRVAFVGDGINDAPVLALSDVGIAMGAMGADMAVETADVVIRTDQPSKVADAIRTGRRTRRIARENIALAVGVKVLVMGLGLAGMANLWAAVFADVGVALLAVLNATRVFFVKD